MRFDSRMPSNQSRSAVVDEVADLEQPVAIDRPVDRLEELVLGRLVVAGADHVGLLARADVPLRSRRPRARRPAGRSCRSAARRASARGRRRSSARSCDPVRPDAGVERGHRGRAARRDPCRGAGTRDRTPRPRLRTASGPAPSRCRRPPPRSRGRRRPAGSSGRGSGGCGRLPPHVVQHHHNGEVDGGLGRAGGVPAGSGPRSAVVTVCGPAPSLTTSPPHASRGISAARPRRGGPLDRCAGVRSPRPPPPRRCSRSAPGRRGAGVARMRLGSC